jgi:iron complex transport system substrate-binding protein
MGTGVNGTYLTVAYALRMRVVSLLPSATELLFAAGGGDLLVGRSHECDWPLAAMRAPILTSARIAHTAGSGGEQSVPVDSAAIDAAVRASIAAGESLYHLDEHLLRELDPDVILTQDLCDVCSIDLRSVERIARTLPRVPKIINLNPTTVWQVLDDVLTVGEAIGRPAQAQAAATALRDRLWTASERSAPFVDGPSVLFLEWTDPPFVGGHWTPELITLAGGLHPLNAVGCKSRVATPNRDHCQRTRTHCGGTMRSSAGGGPRRHAGTRTHRLVGETSRS